MHNLIEAFVRADGTERPEAVARIADDGVRLLEFHRYPAKHRIQLRTTNPIGSVIPAARLRTEINRALGSPGAARTIMFQLVESSHGLRCETTETRLAAVVRACGRSENDVLVEGTEAAA
ncbi:hypothetical protein [Streptomyces sp. NPDC048462]|uniref:hypothetical protein n=1 Tax=Streptomyces sp. NPDC048462 TaxID=3365555 RepID=UPI00371D056A